MWNMEVEVFAEAHIGDHGVGVVKRIPRDPWEAISARPGAVQALIGGIDRGCGGGSDGGAGIDAGWHGEAGDRTADEGRVRQASLRLYKRSDAPSAEKVVLIAVEVGLRLIDRGEDEAVSDIGIAI